MLEMLEKRERESSLKNPQSATNTRNTRHFWRPRRWWNPEGMMSSSGRELGATRRGGKGRIARSLWDGGGGLHLPHCACRPGSLDQQYMAMGSKTAGPAQGGGAQAEPEPSWLGESAKTSTDNSRNQRPRPLTPSCYSRGNHKIRQAKTTQGTAVVSRLDFHTGSFLPEAQMYQKQPRGSSKLFTTTPRQTRPVRAAESSQSYRRALRENDKTPEEL